MRLVPQRAKRVGAYRVGSRCVIDRCRIRSYAYIGVEGDSSVVGRPLTLAASLADP
jgi:hypothetical protein